MLKTLSERYGWRRIGIVTAAVLAMLGLGATTAMALTTAHSANRFVQFQARTGDTAWTGAGTAWTDVPGASMSFTVPSGQTRMFQTTFTAESLCSGTGGWCSARVVIVTPGGSVVELRPIVGTDYAYDSPGGSWEAHSMNRTSFYWGAGTYQLKVQAARVGTTGFRLDDWNFGVTAMA